MNQCFLSYLAMGGERVCTAVALEERETLVKEAVPLEAGNYWP